MNMLDYTREALDKAGAFVPAVNPYIEQITNAIPFPTVPDRMKTVIALAQLTTYASQFRRNITLWDDSIVPINAISFVITGSGAGKDSSVKAARKCFTDGYNTILDAREALANQAAIAAATAAGEDPADDPSVYEPYREPLPPIDIMPTTGPGFIQHVNDIGKNSLTAGFLYSGEFADELAYNQDMLDDIKILSETYDTGDKEIKYTKGAEFRSEEIKSQPVSALLVGSPTQILFDEQTKKKFEVAFMSKLARRSWFCYAPERIPEPDFTHYDDPIEAMLEHKYNMEIASKTARTAMADAIVSITDYGLATAGQPLTITENGAVFKLFETYKRYNSELADTLPNQSSTAVLVRRHLQWKAIKLAGALALFDQSDSIEAPHYIDAIRLCELLSDDMERFEAHLNKAKHEQFVDYAHASVQSDGVANISLHDLKKGGFVFSTSKSKVEELVNLANAYDSEGIYSLIEDGAGILFELIVKTDDLSISYKPIDLTQLDQAVTTGDPEQVSAAKQHIAATTVYGYEVADTTFPKLVDIFQGAFAFSPFKFRDNTRGKDHILGGTKWLVLDVDDSVLTAEETSFMISSFNHHIALTSNATNEYKFRILLELDSMVDVDAITWKAFYAAIAQDLAIKVDPLPQSQIFYAYPNRATYSVTDASPVPVKDYLVAAKEQSHRTRVLPSSKQAKTQLNDPETTFTYAYNAPQGAGSRSLLRMAYHMRDLGASYDEVIQGLTDVNEYWEFPMPQARLNETLFKQVERMF